MGRVPKVLKDLLYDYWAELDYPKLAFGEWFYGCGGIEDVLMIRHMQLLPLDADKKKD